MSRNYPAIHYIQNQMKEFAAGFVDCVVRCFNIMDKNQEPDDCLSNSVARCSYVPKNTDMIQCFVMVCASLSKKSFIMHGLKLMTL